MPSPITALGQIRVSKASLMIPNQMNPTDSITLAAPKSRICRNPRIPPTGPIRFSPVAPDLSANASSNPSFGKSAGLYFTSDNSSNNPTVIQMIPMTSFDHRVGSGTSPRFLLSFAAMKFAVARASPASPSGARLFS